MIDESIYVKLWVASTVERGELMRENQKLKDSIAALTKSYVRLCESWSDQLIKVNEPELFGSPVDTDKFVGPISYTWEYSSPAQRAKEKPLVLSESDNVPCTANAEVCLGKMIAYFDKRAKENQRRAEKADKEYRENGVWGTYEGNNSGYYFSGKADSYHRAANKLRELLGIEPKGEI